MKRLLCLSLVVFALAFAGSVGTASADPPVLRGLSADCSGDLATVTFDWFPVAGAVQYWVDLSLLDNGFAEGTFLGLPSNAERLTWAGLLPGLAHYWRVSALTPDG